MTQEDPDHHDFEPEFDLAAAVQQILRARKATKEAFPDMDDCEPLTYE